MQRGQSAPYWPRPRSRRRQRFLTALRVSNSMFVLCPPATRKRSHTGEPAVSFRRRLGLLRRLRRRRRLRQPGTLYVASWEYLGKRAVACSHAAGVVQVAPCTCAASWLTVRTRPCICCRPPAPTFAQIHLRRQTVSRSRRPPAIATSSWTPAPVRRRPPCAARERPRRGPHERNRTALTLARPHVRTAPLDLVR